MIDLRIIFTNQRGKRVVEEFNTLMDFIIAFEFNNVILNGNKVFAEFFENPLRQKHFNTMQDLYNHCVKITT